MRIGIFNGQVARPARLGAALVCALAPFQVHPNLAVADTAAAALPEGPWNQPALDLSATAREQARRTQPLNWLDPSGLRGWLATASANAIAVRHLPESASNTGVDVGTNFYPFTLAEGQSIADPQFLPGGTQLVFKVQEHADNPLLDSYQLYLLDLKKSAITQLTQHRLHFERVAVSPDGKYLAYVRGPSAQGESAGSLSLCTLELADLRERTLVSNASIVAGGYVWTPENTLLCGLLSDADEATFAQQSQPVLAGDIDQAGMAQEHAQARRGVPVRPAIYEISPAGGPPRLLIRDAWRPALSPDGRRIAFFGAGDPAHPELLSLHWLINPRGANLCVANRDGSARTPLFRHTGAYPTVQWQADGRHLFCLKSKQFLVDLGRYKIQYFEPLYADLYKGGLISLVDSTDGTCQFVGVLGREMVDYQYYQIRPTTDLDYAFTPIGPTADHTLDLFLEFVTVKSKGQHVETLWKAGPTNRFYQRGAELTNGQGLDFYDESGKPAGPVEAIGR